VFVGGDILTSPPNYPPISIAEFRNICGNKAIKLAGSALRFIFRLACMMLTLHYTCDVTELTFGTGLYFLDRRPCPVYNKRLKVFYIQSLSWLREQSPWEGHIS
jgi:hypothetical protein